MRRRFEPCCHIAFIRQVALLKAVPFQREHLYHFRHLSAALDSCIDDIYLVKSAAQIMVGDSVGNLLCLFKGRILHCVEKFNVNIGANALKIHSACRTHSKNTGIFVL